MKYLTRTEDAVKIIELTDKLREAEAKIRQVTKLLQEFIGESTTGTDEYVDAALEVLRA